ncbi:MAG: hypothetical protein IIB54_00130 [Planctomycetes bacterium]|nr:hypothetical protein [Planctomycetota bacterium]
MTSANLPQSNTRNIGNGVQIGKKSIQRRRAESGKPLREGLSQSSRPLFFRASSALFCITLLFSLFFLFSSDQAAAQTGESSPMVLIDSNHQTISPVLSNLDDIIALIEELIRILEEAKRKIEEGPDGKRDDPLVFPLPLSVILDGVQAQIDQLFDPLQDPSLSPVDAGSEERNLIPTTLSEYADVSLALGDEALAAALSLNQPLRDETIGSKLKTLEGLLYGYLLAGLDAGFD